MFDSETTVERLAAGLLEARRDGCALVSDAIDSVLCSEMAAEASQVTFNKLPSTVGAVRQRGFWASASSLDAAGTTWGLAGSLRSAATQVGLRLSPNEVMFQRYSTGGGISAHHDSAHYRAFIAFVGLEGEALFEVLAHRSDRMPRLRWHLFAGDLVVLDGDRRPSVIHRITALSANRLSVALREKAISPD